MLKGVNRIELMLYVAWKYKKILITGLWGCGAFGANPYIMTLMARSNFKIKIFT